MSSDILLWHPPHEQSLILQNDTTYHTGAAKEYNHLLQSERLHQVLQLKITYPYAHICNYTSIPVKQLKKYYEPIFHKEEKFSDIQNSLGLASCLATKTDQFRGRCDPRDPNAGCGHTNKSLAHCSLCATAAALLRASLYMLSANQHANWGNNVSQRLHSCLPSVFRGLHPVFLSFLRKHSACSQHLLINNGLLYCSIQTRFHAISEKAEGNVTDREKLELLWLKRQLRERKKLRGSHCRTLTFRNRVSLRLLVSGPEPLQFQSK